MNITRELAVQLVQEANDLELGVTTVIDEMSQIRRIARETFQRDTTHTMRFVMAEIFRVVAMDYIERRGEILQLLRDLRREHVHCDDSWYCCRACRAADHFLDEGEQLGKGEDGPGDGRCTCGAEATNARIDALLEKLTDAR